MKLERRILFISLSCLLSSSIAVAGDLFAYAPSGRSDDQQRQDKHECHEWAVEQSKFDPVLLASQSSTAAASAAPSSNQASAEKSRSAAPAVVSGAARGALISEAAKGEADRGAAVGAGAGLLRGRMAQRKAAEEKAAAESATQTQNWQQQNTAATQLQARQQDYQRARATCFKARGYTVSEG